MEDAQLSQPDVQPSAYATFTLRARALVTDLAVVGAALAALIVIDTVTDEMPGFGRAFVVLIYALVFLYEPVQVAAFGATIGHRRARIKVVSDSTGGHPSFLIAFVRFLVKSLLGLPSFVVMLFTRRRQAFHDLITRTTVQLREVDEAEIDDRVVAQQAEIIEASMPSLWRRILVTSAYLLVGFMLVGMLSNATLSRRCLVSDACSAGERTLSLALGVASLTIALVVIVLGGQGRLRGARRVDRSATPVA